MNSKLQKVRVHLETIQLNAAGQRGVKPGMWDFCHAAATTALDTLAEVDKVDTIQAQPRCVCNSKKPHFCPPCFGDEGFFACDPEDIVAHVIELADANKAMKFELAGPPRQRLKYTLQLQEQRNQLVIALRRALQRCLDAKVAGYRQYEDDAALLKRIEGEL